MTKASCACDRGLPGGTNECHCTGCGAHFGSPSVFDGHWQGSGDNRHCVDPATILHGEASKTPGQPKYELRDRATGPVWVTAGDGSENPFAAKRAAAAAEGDGLFEAAS